MPKNDHVPFASSKYLTLENEDALHIPDSLTISVSAPGKVILYGEHAVVYGKVAVAASLGLRTRLSLKELPPKPDVPGTVRVELSAVNLVHSYDLNDLQTNLLNKACHCARHGNHANWENPDSMDTDELLNLVRSYVDRTAGSFPLNVNQSLSLYALFFLVAGILGPANVKAIPFVLQVDTDLTVGAGTGSSASFSVVVAAACVQYLRVNGYTAEPEDALRSGLSDFSRFGQRELELISKWAFQAERIVHGMPSGIDNTICTFGSVARFQRGNGSTKLVRLQRTLRLLMISTGVQRETGVLVKAVASWRQRHVHVVESVLDAIDKVSHDALKYLEQLNAAENTSHEEELHSKLRELMDMNQCLLECLRVSHPKLERICEILKGKGLFGKLTGAGGGGYAIALVPPNSSASVVEELIGELSCNGFCAVLTNLGGAGVTIDACNGIE